MAKQNGKLKCKAGVTGVWFFLLFIEMLHLIEAEIKYSDYELCDDNRYLYLLLLNY